MRTIVTSSTAASSSPRSRDPRALRLSVGANVALLVIVGALLWHAYPSSAPSTAASVAHSSIAESDKRTGRGDRRDSKRSADGPMQSALVELNALGISRDTVAQALVNDFSRRWDERMMELRKKYYPGVVPEREEIELSRQRDADQIRELKQAFGEIGYLAWDKDRTLRLMNMRKVTVSPEEAEQAYRLQKEFDERHAELRRAMEDGLADPADAAALQHQAWLRLGGQLEALLGKERLDAMRGNPNPIAEVVWKFAHLMPTPEQAQRVLETEAAHRAREVALSQHLNGNPENMPRAIAELQAMKKAHDENLREIFGAERYDALKRQTDPMYKDLTQYADAWGLKSNEVSSVYDALDAFHDRAENTRMAAQMSEAAGHRVNWREINAAIEQERRQAELGLQALLGDERVRRLKQNGLLLLR